MNNDNLLDVYNNLSDKDKELLDLEVSLKKPLDIVKNKNADELLRLLSFVSMSAKGGGAFRKDYLKRILGRYSKIRYKELSEEVFEITKTTEDA